MLLFFVLTAHTLVTKAIAKIKGPQVDKNQLKKLVALLITAKLPARSTKHASVASDNQGITKRTVTVTFSIKEAAILLGYPKEWYAMNDYLDADSHDDVNHGSYGLKDLEWISTPPGYDDAKKIFPYALLQAHEDADRDAVASEIGVCRRKLLSDAFEKMHVSCEYTGENKEGETVSVSVDAGVTNTDVDTPKDTVKVTLENPEHFINALIDGYGAFHPTEIKVDDILSEQEIKNYLAGHARHFFEIYGNRLPDLDIYSREISSASPDEATLKYHIDDRLQSLSLAEIVEAVTEAVDNEEIGSMEEAVRLAAKFTKTDVAKIHEELLD